MTDAAPAIFVALEASSIGAAIRQSTWLYMAANVGHILSLTVFAGAIAVMDLRMAGFCRDVARLYPALFRRVTRSALPDCCLPARSCSRRKRAT